MMKLFRKNQVEDPENYENSENSENSENYENYENSENSGNSDKSELSENSEQSQLPELRSEAALAAVKAKLPELAGSLEPLISGIAAEFRAGELSEHTLTLLALGADYSDAVARAEAAGELRGRNATIDKTLFDRHDDDGIPHPGSSRCAADGEMSIFDLARTAR